MHRYLEKTNKKLRQLYKSKRCTQPNAIKKEFENNTSVYVFSSYKIFTNASPYAVKRKSMPKYTFLLNVNDKIVKLYLN